MERIALEGEGSLVSLEEEKDDDEKWMKRNGRKGKERSPMSNEWRWRKLL